MTRNVKELLTDPTKQRLKAQGILCYLFRDALIPMKMNLLLWGRCTRRFFSKPHNITTPDRGNLNKALCANDFTWSTFEKAVDFLDAESATLLVRLTYANGHIAEYSIVIDAARGELGPIENKFGFDAVDTIFGDKKPPDSTLAALFRKMVFEQSIEQEQWDLLMEQYVTNPINGIPQTSKDRLAEIGSLTRQLFHPRMSWNVFRKAIVFLQPTMAEFILDLVWTNGTTRHATAITI